MVTNFGKTPPKLGSTPSCITPISDQYVTWIHSKLQIERDSRNGLTTFLQSFDLWDPTEHLKFQVSLVPGLAPSKARNTREVTLLFNLVAKVVGLSMHFAPRTKHLQATCVLKSAPKKWHKSKALFSNFGFDIRHRRVLHQQDGIGGKGGCEIRRPRARILSANREVWIEAR